MTKKSLGINIPPPSYWGSHTFGPRDPEKAGIAFQERKEEKIKGLEMEVSHLLTWAVLPWDQCLYQQKDKLIKSDTLRVKFLPPKTPQSFIATKNGNRTPDPNCIFINYRYKVIVAFHCLK